MEDMYRLCQRIVEELDKIAEKGLTSSNLENAYKLVDMYKDIKNTEYWETKAQYYMQEMGGEYSQRNQRRDSRGRYARNDGGNYTGNVGYSYAGNGRAGESYDRYMDSKRSYRNSHSDGCKQRMMDTLDEYMESFAAQIEEMMRDADCREEKETISRYLQKLKEL